MPLRNMPPRDPPLVFLPTGDDPAWRRARADNTLPLAGVALLAVEDSRVASDVLRLMCQRLGVRLRRAETIRAARAYLLRYRPDIVLIDLGLPDGRGDALIRDLVAAGAPPPAILATSADPDGRATALAAGAAEFLDKPIEGLAAFRDALLRHLPGRGLPLPATEPDNTAVIPDPLALRDDLARARDLIASGPDERQRRYLAGFLTGIGRLAHDTALEDAARAAEDPAGLGRLSGLIAALSDDTPAAFDQPEE